MFKKILFTFLFVATTFSLQAKELAGVNIVESVDVGGQSLSLNGAGVRTKFIFDIYVAAFYTSNSIKKSSQISDDRKPMRMAMHFVYDEVSKEKLVDAWNDGFKDNISSSQLEKLQGRINSFNGMFETVKKGDVILLDYIPNKGTTVTINNKNNGTVSGFDFYQALLMIWLGEDPVGDDLKEALLGDNG